MTVPKLLVAEDLAYVSRWSGWSGQSCFPF